VTRPSVALVTLALLAAGTSRAETEVTGTLDAWLGLTDNAQSAPDNSVPGVPEKKADGFGILAPGLAVSGGSRRVLHRLGATTSVTLHYSERDADTWSNRLEYQGLFALHPRTSLFLGANAMTTRAWSASLISPATELGATLQHSGTTLSLAAEEQLSHDLTRSFSGTQSARFAFGSPLEGERRPYSTDTLVGVGLERTFRGDAVGAELREELATISEPRVRQLTSTGVAIHRHDFGRSFTSRLEAGVLRVDRLTSGRHFWHPSALAALAFAEQGGSAELRYSHRAATSVQVGQTLLVDEVRLTGVLPLVQPRTLVLAGACAYQRGRVIEEDASRGARLDVTLVDLALAWQAAPGLGLGLRYQHTRQLSDGTVPPDPLSYRRNTLLAGATLSWPPETETRRPLRPPQRVDRSDDVLRSRGEQRRVD